MFKLTTFLFFTLIFITPLTFLGGSLEDLGFCHVRQNGLIESRPGGYWHYRINFCGQLYNKSDTDTLRVTPVAYITKGPHESRTKGKIGWGRLISPCACGVDSTFEYILPGETAWFAVMTDSIVGKDFSGIFSWVEFKVK